MLPINTMTTVATKMAMKMADEMFSQKCEELDKAIKLAAKMYVQRCDDLDEKLADSFIAAFEGEKISKAKMKRIAGKFADVLLDEEVVVDALL